MVVYVANMGHGRMHWGTYMRHLRGKNMWTGVYRADPMRPGRWYGNSTCQIKFTRDNRIVSLSFRNLGGVHHISMPVTECGVWYVSADCVRPIPRDHLAYVKNRMFEYLGCDLIPEKRGFDQSLLNYASKG